ncbi:hypothetical protein ACUY1T_21440 [Billgrantia sp. Q4P2]|uniref:hypothetical protein n=1 Tax=Billgrantia sp. Q4P2 TaxID=3463857 RepID=UPI0040566380
MPRPRSRAKNRYLPDEPRPADPESLQLQHSLEVLKPIRAHRRLMAERRWRRERQALAQLHDRVQERQAEGERRRQSCQQRRGELAGEHQSRRISHESLEQWMGEEKQLLKSIEAIDRELHQLQQSLEEQEGRVEEAKRQAELQQREEERLMLFTQALEEES